MANKSVGHTTCPECKREVSVQENGKIRYHVSGLGPGPRVRCPGVGLVVNLDTIRVPFEGRRALTR